MDPLLRQRLHISGLTPNLSSADLSKIISKFGTVKAVDGVGQLNGVGLPRNFAFVTVSTTESDLRKC
jgi:RNA recognition motif-containing protein